MNAALNGKVNSSDVFLLKGSLGTNDLNNIIGTDYQGIWCQNATANATTTRNYPVVSAGNLLVFFNSVSNYGITQIYITHVSKRVFIRSKPTSSDAWTAFWTSDSLVKQTSQDDTTTGSVVLNGGHGLGANARPRAAGATGVATGCGFFSYTANHADNPFGGIGASGVHVQEAAGYGWDLLGRDGSGADFRMRQISAAAAGPWYTLWTSANLVKQTGPFDATVGSLALNNAWGFGAAAQLAATNDFFEVLTSNQAKVVKASGSGSGSGWPSNEVAWTGIHLPFNDCAAATLAILPAGTLSGVRVAVYARRSSTNLGWTELWTERNLTKPATLDTVQTVTAVKTHTVAVVTANAVAFRGTYTDGTVRNLAQINASNIVHLGDGAASTTIHGSSMPLIQIGSGSSYEVVDAGTPQTLTGAKTFTAPPIFENSSQLISIVSPGVSPGTLGRSFDISSVNGTPSRFVLSRRISPNSGTNQQFINISFPTAGNGTALVTNYNAFADSNGFWKTASPVVKLFSNGTSELNGEAEGITTERLSEGVYRISGCLGLNADRAWGGDEGGIDVPMCRNKLPRLWVDYGGDEGSAKINPDGSIVIRTYHRPHPDAPAFARNEIEGYANGDPIDIPRDTFISVRVQMPEVEVQEAVVETVPNEVENDVFWKHQRQCE